MVHSLFPSSFSSSTLLSGVFRQVQTGKNTGNLFVNKIGNHFFNNTANNAVNDRSNHTVKNIVNSTVNNISTLADIPLVMIKTT